MNTLSVRLTAAGACALFAMSAFPAAALTPRAGDSVLVSQSETISDDLYAAGATIILNGAMNGDAYVGGGTVVVNGAVRQDLVVGGGNVTVAGNVGDDLRMAGGNITLLKNVKGDVLMAGGNVIIGKDSVIDGDLVVGGGSLVVEGTVKGNVRAGGGQVVLNGPVAGFIEVDAENLRLGGNARLARGLRYRSPEMATMDEGAKVVGGVDYVKVDRKKFAPPQLGRDAKPGAILGALIGFVALVFLVKLFAMMIAAVVLVSCFGTYSNKVVDHALNKPDKALLSGFAVLILTPVAALVLALTILGAPLAGLLGLGYGFLVMLAKIYAGVVLGALLWRMGSKGRVKGVDWKGALVGTFLLGFLCLVPILGWIVYILAFLAALGGIYAMAEEKIKAMK